MRVSGAFGALIMGLCSMFDGGRRKEGEIGGWGWGWGWGMHWWRF